MIESGLRAARAVHGPVHVAAPLGAHRAHPHRRPADLRRANSPPHSTGSTPRRSACSPSGRIDLHTTYFETVTAMALLVLSGRDVVLEVGLGGRLDATNVVHPALTVITPIDFDHEQFLGKSLESIAAREGRYSEAGRPRCIRAPASRSRRRPRPPRCGIGESRLIARRIAKSTTSSSTRAAAGSAPATPDRMSAGRRAPGGERGHRGRGAHRARSASGRDRGRYRPHPLAGAPGTDL